jgi:hypothetical protein
MKWMLAIFFVVFLIIVDQSWYRGQYTDHVARTLSKWLR